MSKMWLKSVMLGHFCGTNTALNLLHYSWSWVSLLFGPHPPYFHPHKDLSVCVSEYTWAHLCKMPVVSCSVILPVSYLVFRLFSFLFWWWCVHAWVCVRACEWGSLSLLSWKSLIWLGEPRGPACLLVSNSGIRSHTTTHSSFIVLLGTELTFPGLHYEHFTFWAIFPAHTREIMRHLVVPEVTLLTKISTLL